MLPKIRGLQPDDLSELVKLCAAHAAYERACYASNGKRERLRQLFFETSPSLRGLVADAGGELIGYATWVPQMSTWAATRYAYLDCLFVRERHRNKGVGRLLLAGVAEQVIQANLTELQWQTPSFNAGAIRFYDRIGGQSTPKARYVLDPRDLIHVLQPNTNA